VSELPTSEMPVPELPLLVNQSPREYLVDRVGQFFSIVMDYVELLATDETDAQRHNRAYVHACQRGFFRELQQAHRDYPSLVTPDVMALLMPFRKCDWTRQETIDTLMETYRTVRQRSLEAEEQAQ
jgi:hypothetical protein